MNKLLKSNAILKEFYQELKKKYQENLVKVILFGSQARGDHNNDSDIDLMVIFKNPICLENKIIEIADIAVPLELKYQQMISVIPMTEEDYQTRKSPFLENIRREGIKL